MSERENKRSFLKSKVGKGILIAAVAGSAFAIGEVERDIYFHQRTENWPVQDALIVDGLAGMLTIGWGLSVVGIGSRRFVGRSLGPH